MPQPHSLLLLLLPTLFHPVIGDVTITLINKCPYTVWPGIQGNPLPKPSGFELKAGASHALKVADGWIAARIWGRTGCTGPDGSLVCEACSCGNKVDCEGRGGEVPCSLAEFTLDSNGQDWYDVSFVDGSNIPMTITPVEGTYSKPGTYEYDCTTAGYCTQDLKQVATKELQQIVNGKVVGTKSACSATNDPKMCCSGEYNTPEKCPKTNFPPKFYSDLKKICPTSYFYAYDDHTSTFTCRGAKGRKSPDYKITFCEIQKPKCKKPKSKKKKRK